MHPRFSALVTKRRDAAEQRIFKLIGLLIEDYDRRHGMPHDDSTPSEILQFLLEHSGKSAADLLPIFRTKSHVSEALASARSALLKRDPEKPAPFRPYGREKCLEPLRLRVTEAARVLEVSRQALNNLVNEKAGISAGVAVRLTKAFGSTPRHWSRRQAPTSSPRLPSRGFT